MKEIKNSQGLRNVSTSFGNLAKMHLMTMKVNGLLRKSKLQGKMGGAYDGTLPHAPVARSQTLPWHAPVARSRMTLPRARAPAGTTSHQARNPNHGPPRAPVARSRTLPWHDPVSRSPARARSQAPRATKLEILMENTFTNGLRLNKT